VTVFDEKLEDLCQELLKIMYDEDGVGLAAPQVGINKRIMVFNEVGDYSKVDKETILINPVIVSKSEETDLRQEGCLSFPMINGRVYRSLTIDIEYQDLKGNKKSMQLTGFPARIFQHEYDHLDRVLFIDRFIDEDKAINEKRLSKMVKRYGPGAAI
jgi:peptide deformylase